jgi:hypothetical protein
MSLRNTNSPAEKSTDKETSHTSATDLQDYG